MRFEFFAIPALHPQEAVAELNQFLASHRVCSVTRELIADGANSYWTVCVEWTPGRGSASASVGADRKSRIDYREVLPPDQFSVFSKLRSLRKELAEKDGVPPYALFTNEHLAEMVRQKMTSLTALQSLDGVGPSKSEKYGAAFLELLKSELGDSSELSESSPDGQVNDEP
ncbi:MAG: HRDC domain-containing protein [Rhodopirellula sp.]|nr:HRDC domain-containing protein [Rhodopirellula sp.]